MIYSYKNIIIFICISIYLKIVNDMIVGVNNPIVFQSITEKSISFHTSKKSVSGDEGKNQPPSWTVCRLNPVTKTTK